MRKYVQKQSCLVRYFLSSASAERSLTKTSLVLLLSFLFSKLPNKSPLLIFPTILVFVKILIGQFLNTIRVRRGVMNSIQLLNRTEGTRVSLYLSSIFREYFHPKGITSVFQSSSDSEKARGTEYQPHSIFLYWEPPKRI